MHERSVVAAKVISVSSSEILPGNEDAVARALLDLTMASSRKENLVGRDRVEDDPPVLQADPRSAASLPRQADLDQIVVLFDRFRSNLTLRVAAALEALPVTVARVLVMLLANPIEVVFST